MTTKYIDPKLKAIMRDGFAPWGRAIPGAKQAPKGSVLYQFRRVSGKKVETRYAVVDPRGRVVRMN